jgi:hypothetical protein
MWRAPPDPKGPAVLAWAQVIGAAVRLGFGGPPWDNVLVGNCSGTLKPRDAGAAQA